MIGGRAAISWGEPCCAACAAGAAAYDTNPPSDGDPADELAAVVGLYDFLGEAVAWGALAHKLGLPAGAALVAKAADFAATSPTIGEAETGSVLSGLESAVVQAERAAPKAWTKIEAAAGRTLETLSKGKGLIAIGVGGLLASQFISDFDKRKLTALAADKALVGDNLARLEGPELAAALRDLHASSNGGLFDGLAGIVPWVVGGLALWFGLPLIVGLMNRGGVRQNPPHGERQWVVLVRDANAYYGWRVGRTFGRAHGSRAMAQAYAREHGGRAVLWTQARIDRSP